MRYALVKNGVVENVVLIADINDFDLDEGVTAVQSDTLNVGDDPLNPPDPNAPTVDLEPVEVTVDGLRVRNSQGEVSVITADNDGNLHVDPEA
jgi:hypothetical protein